MDSVVTENNELEFQLKPFTQDDSCDLNPEFAVICSFIADFGDKIDLELNIEQLKSSIENQNRLDNRLVDLHVKLLKKLRRYFIRDQWEKALIRFASEYSYEDAFEIERFGYLKTRPSIKLQLLRRLLDAQFECDQKFKGAVNLIEADQLRKLPLGRDAKGNTYWQRTDNEGNFRIFQEQPMDYKSWKTICSKPEELKYLIDELESTQNDRIKGEPMTEPYDPLPEIFPELFEVHGEEIEEKLLPKKAIKGRRSKKGGRGKKPGPLETVEEESVDIQTNGDHVIGEDVKPSCNGLKVEPNSHALVHSDQAPRSPESSIESQVKSTVENLMSMVVASFEFIKRPLSRLSSSPVEREKEPAPKKSRKKQPKREKKVEEVLPRRSSSRIQQIALKKIAEEEEKMKKMIESTSNEKPDFVPEPDETSRGRSTSSRNNRNRSESPEASNKPGKRKKKGSKSWRRGKGKKKLSWDKDDSDLSSTSSVTPSNDEDDDFEDLEPLKFDNSNDDDEFACEDEETNNEPVIIKRARTARQTVPVDEKGDLNNSSNTNLVEEDKPCGRCDKSDNPEWILLCDLCDDGYHTTCCVPPLMIVPDGDWFCPPCEHKTLLTKLKELYASIIEILETRERERIKRQRLRQTNVKKEPVKMEVVKGLPEKRSRDILNELSEPLALQELNDELDESSDNSSSSSDYGRQRIRVKRYRTPKTKKAAKKKPRYEDDEEGFRVNYKKTPRTYSRHRIEESDESESEESEASIESSEDEPKPKTRRACASVSYRFQEYDELIKSAIQAESASEHSEDSEEKSQRPFQSRGKDMATIEALAYQQENGITDQPPLQVATDEPSGKPKRKSRRLNDLDADTENEDATSDESFQASSATELEEDDEEEDDDVTEVDSDSSIDELVSRKKPSSKGRRGRKRRSTYESDDSDFKPRTSRRAAANQVSYKESSDEDAMDLIETTKHSKRNVLHSDEESDASWKSSGEAAKEQSTSGDDSQEVAVKKEEAVAEVSKKPEQADNLIQQEPSEAAPVKPRGKKIRLEKKATKAIVDPNQSLDELVAPFYSATPQVTAAPVPSSHCSKPVLQNSAEPKHLVGARDPIQELDQYCSERAHPTNMFDSYNETLSREQPREQPSSPPHPSFYEDDDPKPTTSNGKQKRAKKAKASTSKKPSELIEPKTSQKTAPKVSEKLKAQIPPTPVQERPSLQQPRFEQSLPPRQTRPLVATPPRYHTSQSIQNRVYSPVQAPAMPYPRVTYPEKYSPIHAQTPPTSQSHPIPYPQPYSTALPMMVPQPQSSAPIGPYSNSQHLPAPGMWGQVLQVPGSSPRQPVPNVFYSPTGAPIHNPHFSIHQLLGSPYSMASMSTQPSPMSQPPSSTGSPSVTSQPGHSQGSSTDGTDGRPNTDKDMIRGMSDVISFIGDT